MQTITHGFPRARRAFEKSPARLVQLLANVPTPQNSATKKNNSLHGTPERHAQSAPRVGTTAEDVTPADHIIALAIGLAFCIETLSVVTPKKGRGSNNQRCPASQPSGYPVPPNV